MLGAFVQLEHVEDQADEYFQVAHAFGVALQALEP